MCLWFVPGVGCKWMKASSRITVGTDSANISSLVPGAPRNSVVVHKHPERVELKNKKSFPGATHE